MGAGEENVGVGIPRPSGGQAGGPGSYRGSEEAKNRWDDIGSEGQYVSARVKKKVHPDGFNECYTLSTMITQPLP